MPAPDPCEYLDWDSRFFGRRIARVTTSPLTPESSERVLAWCDAHATECLYLLVDAADSPTTRCAEDARFRLVDLRVTLDRRTGERREPDESVAPVIIRPAEPGDLPGLRAIARVSHHDSRFYQDGAFPAARCDTLYERWIERSCQGYADAVFVAVLGTRVAGYVTCHRRGTDVGQIGLFAVDLVFQGKGLGRALSHHSLDWFAREGLAEVTVVTQGRNLAAQRLYQRCGFLTKSVELWYHHWFDRDETSPRP